MKSFLEISLIFIGLVRIRFTDETIGISKQLMVIVTLSNDTTMTSPWFYFVTVDTFGISAFIMDAALLDAETNHHYILNVVNILIINYFFSSLS